MIAAVSMGAISAAISEDINANNTIAANDISDTSAAANDMAQDTITTTDSTEDISASDSESTSEKASADSQIEPELSSANSENQLSATYTDNGEAENQMSNGTIQAYINKAKAGDTIIINGTYYEHCHFVVNKKLTIISYVNTYMSMCPSHNTIFNITKSASGTIIKGFILECKSNPANSKDYAIYVNGASNVLIDNCTIEKINNGDGICIVKSTNSKINNTIIQNCKINGISVENSSQISITNNNITKNTDSGINIGENNKNITIEYNNITYNSINGINTISGDNIYILNNYVTNNQKNGYGVGIYINCNVTKIEIKGNVILSNGYYGVLSDYRVRNVVSARGAEKLIYTENNYFGGHNSNGRAVYHIQYKETSNGDYIYDAENDEFVPVSDGSGNYYMDKTVVYLGHAINLGDNICGSTLYAGPATTYDRSKHLLHICEIEQVKKGVYHISIADVNGNIAKDFNGIYVTFYLNKNNTSASPQEGDIYKIVRMQNGVATVDFRDIYDSFKETGNVITAVLPGTSDRYTSSNSKTFNVSDSDIPPEFRETTLSASGMSVLAKSGKYFTVTLKDSTNAPVSGETITFKISGSSASYTATTDANGQAKMLINMAAGTYTVTATHLEEGSYGASSAKATVTVYQLSSSIKSSNMKIDTIYGKYYSITLKDSNGNPISGKKVTFTVNKKTYKATSNSKGVAKAKIKIKKNGKYKITIKFAGNDQYKASTAKKTITVKIGSKKTKLTIKKLTTYPDSGKYYSAKLTTKKGKAIKGQKITFTVNGNTYIKKTNKKGVAKFKIAIIKTGKYKVTARYNGTSKYRGTTKKNYIKIKTGSKKTSIKSQNAYMNPNSGEYYQITLKNNKGKTMKKAIIRFTVNKKTYKVKTNSKGVAKVKINLNSGKYTIESNFAGNSKFKAKTVKNTITVRTKTSLSSSDASYTYISDKPYTATLKDASGKAIKGKTIYFTVNSKQYQGVTDDNGIAVVQLDLPIGNYTITSSFNTDNDYVGATKTSKISVENSPIILETYNKTYGKDSNKAYHAIAKDEKGNAYKNQSVTFSINGVEMNATTNDNGVARIELDLSDNAEVTTSIYVDYRNETLSNTNLISISDEENKTFIDIGISNDEIQNTIDDCLNDTNLEFLGSEYYNVSLIINKTLNLIPNTNTVLNGAEDSVVITLLEGATGSAIRNLIINASGSGILINGAKEVIIENNIIANALNESLIDDYNNGSTPLPGRGVSIINSSNVNVTGNNISSFESGVYIQSSDSINTSTNLISKNNYGITYGKGVANTTIYGNKIVDNIGWLVMDVPEGPNGYGIYLNESAVNVSITQNNISNNYMGISIDCKNSTGIVITGNCISYSVTEGIRFNAGYGLAENCVEPNVTDNAIYRNAKGPSLWILGEMSANPNGIYGPGENDSSLRLKLDANWYGTNKLITWDQETGIVGVGTMCPRIQTTAIYFENLTHVSEGVYNISFYKGVGDNKELASNLGTFDMYATLNNGTENAVECHFLVENGVGTITFDTSKYNAETNKIDISVGSLSDTEREYSSLLTYNIIEN